MYVLLSGRRRKTSTARFLSALAVADIIVLMIPAMEYWALYVIHVDVRATVPALCKVLSYLAYLTPSTSAWILVTVTLERALSVWFPHRVNVMCQPRTAFLSVGTLAFPCFNACSYKNCSLYLLTECPFLKALKHLYIANIFVYSGSHSHTGHHVHTSRHRKWNRHGDIPSSQR